MGKDWFEERRAKNSLKRIKHFQFSSCNKYNFNYFFGKGYIFCYGLGGCGKGEHYWWLGLVLKGGEWSKRAPVGGGGEGRSRGI